MSAMAFSMYQFTKGEGTLRTTQDLFTQAEYFAEEANRLYKVVRQFSYQVPAGAPKKELLDHLDKVPTYVQTLQFTVKDPTVGKAATFVKVDHVIQETKNLMNVISKVVSTCFDCANKVRTAEWLRSVVATVTTTMMLFSWGRRLIEPAPINSDGVPRGMNLGVHLHNSIFVHDLHRGRPEREGDDAHLSFDFISCCDFHFHFNFDISSMVCMRVRTFTFQIMAISPHLVSLRCLSCRTAIRKQAPGKGITSRCVCTSSFLIE